MAQIVQDHLLWSGRGMCWKQCATALLLAGLVINSVEINQGQNSESLFYLRTFLQVVLVFRYTVFAKEFSLLHMWHSSPTLPETYLQKNSKVPPVTRSSLMNVVTIADRYLMRLFDDRNVFICPQICHSEVWPDFKEHKEHVHASH